MAAVAREVVVRDHAEIVELKLHELAGDLARGIEIERVGAPEIGFGLGELFLGRTVGGEPRDLARDDFERLLGTIEARCGGAAGSVRRVCSIARSAPRLAIRSAYSWTR